MTLVHFTAYNGLFQVLFYFLDEVGIDPDIILQSSKQSLLHLIAKHIILPWNNEEKEYI